MPSRWLISRLRSAWCASCCDLATQLWHTQMAERSHIDLHLTQDDLASLSGTTRETVNRVLSNLRDQGLIRVERARVSVLKMQQLEDTRE